MSTPKATDAPITKRLHVSGLTPNITIDDLSKRLSTFGTVTALDKFGEKDAVGQVKKFGYVTLETTQGKLARCMNLLSGTTWKGAKLRIGEAKPDWRERLEKERSTPSPPKTKKPKRYGGIYADDMSPVTPSNATTRPGWKVTPLGRVLHPVKMRPAHPLPATKEEVEVRRKEEEAARKGKVVGKKRKRVKEPDTRARRRTIDVTKWGSTHLKGVFLDAIVADGGVGLRGREGEVGDVRDVEMSSEVESEEEEEEEESEEIGNVDQKVPAAAIAPAARSPQPPIPTLAPAQAPATAPPTTSIEDDETDITAEKSRSLNLLASLFGNINTNDLDDDDDWAGRESVGSDIDEEALKRSQKDVLRERSGGNEGDDDIEIVPLDGRGKKKGGKERKERVEKVVMQEDESEEEEDVEMAEPDMVKEKAVPSPQPASSPQAPPKQKTNLKDLFAPREEEAGFSLIGHLDLDLELDDEVPFAIGEATSTADQVPVVSKEIHTPLPTAAATTRALKSTSQTLYLDPKKPLFFPHRPSQSDQPITKARPKDILEHFVELGWGWRGTPGTSAEEKERMFCRTGTEEEIRKRWEERKVELTREWKRRHKEASKFSRRRRGGDAGDGEMV